MSFPYATMVAPERLLDLRKSVKALWASRKVIVFMRGSYNIMYFLIRQ